MSFPCYPEYKPCHMELMLGQTTLETEFSGYLYGCVDWLREQEKKV